MNEERDIDVEKMALQSLFKEEWLIVNGLPTYVIKIGDVVINRGIVAPVARKVARDWKSLKSFRARRRAERRSKTLVWFEDRVTSTKRANEM